MVYGWFVGCPHTYVYIHKKPQNDVVKYFQDVFVFRIISRCPTFLFRGGVIMLSFKMQQGFNFEVVLTEMNKLCKTIMQRWLLGSLFVRIDVQRRCLPHSRLCHTGTWQGCQHKWQKSGQVSWNGGPQTHPTCLIFVRRCPPCLGYPAFVKHQNRRCPSS